MAAARMTVSARACERKSSCRARLIVVLLFIGRGLAVRPAESGATEVVVPEVQQNLERVEPAASAVCDGSCCEAKQEQMTNVYRVGQSQARLMEVCDQWELRSDGDCGGRSAGTVFVLARPNATDPLNSSSAVIIVNSTILSGSGYVCCVANISRSVVVPAAWCFARVTFQQRQGVRHLLLQMHDYIFGTPLKALEEFVYDADQFGRVADCVECVLLLAALLFILSLVHTALKMSSLEMVEKPLWPAAIPRESSWQQTTRAWGAMLGVVATISTMLSLSLTVLAEENQPQFLTIALMWPCVFGVPGVARFMLAHCKVQLTNAALLHGVCLAESEPNWRCGPLTVGLLVLVACLLCANTEVRMLIFVIGTLSGPIWTIGRGTLNWRKIEESLRDSHVLMTLRGTLTALGWKENVTRPHLPTDWSGDGQLASQADDDSPRNVYSAPARGDRSFSGDAPMDCALRDGDMKFHKLDAFVYACSQGVDPIEALQTRLSGSHAALWNLPMLTFIFLVLATQTVVWGTKYSTEMPVLATLRSSAGTLVPAFDPYITEYDLVLQEMEQHTSLYVRTRSPWNKASFWPHPDAGGGASAQVSMDTSSLGFPYSVTIAVSGVSGRVIFYNINLLRLYARVDGIIMKDVDGGFDRCVEMGAATRPNIVSFPRSTSNIAFIASFKIFVFGMPVGIQKYEREAALAQLPFRTIFVPMSGIDAIDGCRAYCKVHRHCLFEVMAHNGCYFMMGPSGICRESFDSPVLSPLRSSMQNRTRWPFFVVNGRICFGRCSGRSYADEHGLVHFWGSKNWQMPNSAGKQRQILAYLIMDWLGTRTFEGVHQVLLNNGTDSGLIAMVAHVEGIETNVSRNSGEERSEDSLLSDVVDILLSPFSPLERDHEPLCLHIAAAAKDSGMGVQWPQSSSHGRCTPRGTFADIPGLCDRQDALALSVCGGPWESVPMAFEINPWELGAFEVKLVPVPELPALQARTVSLQVHLSNEKTPIDEVLSNMTHESCFLDLRDMKSERKEVYDLILSEKLFYLAAMYCLDVQFYGPSWLEESVQMEGTVVQFLLWGLSTFPEIFENGVSLIVRTELNLAFEHIVQDLGLKADAEGVFVPLSAPLRPLYLPFSDVAWHSQNGLVVSKVCRMLPETAPHEKDEMDEVLLQEIAYANYEVVHELVECVLVKKLKGNDPFSKIGALSIAPYNAIDVAVNYNTVDILKEVLLVYDSSIQNPYHASPVVYALQEGCPECILPMVEGGMDASELQFEVVEQHVVRTLQMSASYLHGKVRSVVMQGCGLRKMIFEELQREGIWMELGSSVTELNLRDNLLSPDEAVDIVDMLRNLTHLERLLLESNELWSKTAGTDDLAEAIGSLPRLWGLGLSGTSMTERAGIRLAAVLPDLQLLRQLYLDGNQLGPWAGEALERGVANLTRLERVHVGGNRMGGKVVFRLLQSLLPSAGSLYDLSLRSDDIIFDEDDLCQRIPALLVHNFTRLEKLDISNNTMNSASADMFMSELAQHPRLRKVRALHYSKSTQLAMLRMQPRFSISL